MKKVLVVALTLALSLGFSAVAKGPGGPAAGNPGQCVQAGIGTLQSLGLLTTAAQKGIDYSTLADADEGPIFADLPAGSFLSLGQVVKLHTSNPELFAWCQ
jgi:hypothetical protein